MKRIKFLAVLASAFIAFGYASFQVNATEDIIPQNYGYKEVEIEVDRAYTDEEIAKLTAAEAVPAKYDSRDYGRVPAAVRDQNPYGTCWSFSTMAALEGSALSQGWAPDIDLSEYHLVNYHYQFVTDPLGGTAGDDIIFHGSMYDCLNEGGNVLVAYNALANWIGAAKDTGYVEDPNYVMPKTVESAYLNDIVHLEDAMIISKYDTVAVKQAIMDHGIITASYGHYEDFMNNTTGAYYNDWYPYSNHAIAIVGWDDNYSKTNFLTQPAKDGAWLVRNSWGDWWANDGYFWMSYEDVSLQEAMCVLVAAPADNYDHNYQYDGVYMSGYYGLNSVNTMQAANVFKVPATANKEFLEAVSIDVSTSNVDYEVQIYKNPTNASNPTSGTAMLATPVKGSLTFQGFYTIELPEAVSLEPGDTFSVVFTLTNRVSNDIAVTVEYPMMWGSMEFITSAEAGQSFLGTSGGWYDLGANEDLNVRIKAFTTDYVDPEPGNIFSDVSMNDWFYPYVKEAYDMGVMSGVGTDANGKIIFKPLVNLPREQFVTVLFALSDVDPSTIQYTGKFTDVKESDWFAKPVEWAAQNGIVSGIAEGKFGVGVEITREQMAVMLRKYAEVKGFDVTATADISSFPDANEVSSWAKEAMGWAIQNGVMSGQDVNGVIYLKPLDKASRAVCATMIVAFDKKF